MPSKSVTSAFALAALCLTPFAAAGPEELYGKNFTSPAQYITPYPGGGSCALDPTPPAGEGMLEGSLSENDYFGSASCGMCVEVTPLSSGPITGRTMVFVNDLCPRCKDGELGIAMIGGNEQNIRWRPVECPVGNDEVQMLFSGDSKNYLKFQLRNTPAPARRVEIKAGGDWVQMERTPDNYFAASSLSGFDFPLETRITLVNDFSGEHVLEERGKDGEIIKATAQNSTNSDSDSNSDGSDGSDGSGPSTSDGANNEESGASSLSYNKFMIAVGALVSGTAVLAGSLGYC